MPLPLVFECSRLLIFLLFEVVDCLIDGVSPEQLRVTFIRNVESWSILKVVHLLFDDYGVPRPKLHQTQDVLVYFLIYGDEQLAHVDVFGA